MFTHLFVALLLGGLIGLERAIADKGVGMRTYALVSMGSAFFVLISEYVIFSYGNTGVADPLRMASSIVTGIGFIGAGLFVFQEKKIHNITTAAGMWVASGIGIACGYGLYEMSIIVVVLTLFIFTAMWFLEKKITSITDKWLN